MTNLVMSIASIRRAASEEFKARGYVTIPAIAERMGKPAGSVASFIKSTKIENELGVDLRIKRGCVYVSAVERIEQAGVRVTLCRIAILANSNLHATRAWMQRNPSISKRVTHLKTHRQLLFITRASWIVRTMKVCSVSMLAHHLDSDRTRLYKLFWRKPEFRKQLGI